MRPFAPPANPLENSFEEQHPSMEETLIPNLQREESPTRFPIFTEDVSPLINRTTSPFKPVAISPSELLEQSNINERIASSEITLQQPAPEEDIINPLDRPSSPEPPQNPFTDPAETEYLASREDIDPSESHYEDAVEDAEVNVSRPSSRTMSLHSFARGDDIDDVNSMSDWTEAFDNNTDSEAMTDVDSDSDVVSDAESEASWARVRSSRLEYN